VTISMERRAEPTASRRRAAARILSATLATILGIVALAACAPTKQATVTPTATARAQATPAPRLVYQADWSHGLAGWSATPGWATAGGVLQSDTGSDRQITVPFHPTTPNYAVEYHLQIVSLSPTAATQYALSAIPAGNVDGFIALVEHISFSTARLFPNHAHEMIYIDPMTDMPDRGVYTLQIHDFDPGTKLRTYRVEVRGADVVLLIDGKVASWAHTSKGTQLATGALRFYCTGVNLRLSDFKVYSL
jgi:hypothetical protein